MSYSRFYTLLSFLLYSSLLLGFKYFVSLDWMSSYLASINIIVLFILGLDKGLAQSQSIRVPEKVLLGLSLLGGSIGAIIGMKLVRHKIRKDRFVFQIGVILIIQILALALI